MLDNYIKISEEKQFHHIVFLKLQKPNRDYFVSFVFKQMLKYLDLKKKKCIPQQNESSKVIHSNNIMIIQKLQKLLKEHIQTDNGTQWLNFFSNLVWLKDSFDI